jgi:putative FmdB family regulatory protein
VLGDDEHKGFDSPAPHQLARGAARLVLADETGGQNVGIQNGDDHAGWSAGQRTGTISPVTTPILTGRALRAMPTYSYHCDTCGHDFEAVQRFADEPLSECPECGAPIRRVIQPVGVVFKGSGWYITDSRPKSSSDSGDSAAKAKTSEKPKKSDKADSATASTSEKSVAKVAD